MSKKKVTHLPEGHHTVNPFIICNNTAEVIKFIVEVFDGKEDKNALTYDNDGLIIHSEVRVGDSTIMLGERKKEWRFTPSFTQVYVSDIELTLQRAEKLGAKIITKPTEYIGVKFSRIQDPERNIWWVYEQIENYDWKATFGEGDEETWKPTKEANYIHSTLLEAMKKLAED